MSNTKQFTSVEEYIKGFPEETQIILQTLREMIQAAAPESVETINYNIPAFDLRGKHLVYFAGWKDHISLYPAPKGDAVFQTKIAQYRDGKGTLKFPTNKPIPYELIIKVVNHLIDERLD
ncbi:MAG: iron chaperone [Candidatus Levyibacteriota bacterium]